MPQGAYLVVDDNGSTSFRIEPDPAHMGPIPEEQSALRSEILNSLTVLNGLILKEKDQERIGEYVSELRRVAATGLSGPSANPLDAGLWLVALRDRVTSNEGGRAKHRHIKALAKWALGTSGACFVVAFVMQTLPPIMPFLGDRQLNMVPVTNFFFLCAGCAAGVWVSFAARRTRLQFSELHIPEPDQLQPLVRVGFATVFTVILALLLDFEVVKLGLGSRNSGQVLSDNAVAWLIGAICGFTEKLLSQQVLDQVTRILRVQQREP
jgi:hypothetical protein